MAAWIAYDVALLCADHDGRIARNQAYFDYVVRAALLVDLALCGRLRTDRETDWLDPTPTGNPLADEMLADIAARPTEPLSRAVTSGPGSAAVIAQDPRVPLRRWRRAQVDLAAVQRVLARIDVILGLPSPAAHDAALAVLAATLLSPPARWDDLIAKAGRARDLLGDLVDFLITAKSRFDFSGAYSWTPDAGG